MKRRNRPNRRAAAAVEFALAISILLMIVFASIEFVRLNILKHSVEHASYLAARNGIIVGAQSSNVEAVARNHLALLSVANATVTIDPQKIDDETQIVEVLIEVPVSGNSWISPVYFQGTLVGRTRMLAERAAAKMAAALPTP